MILTEERVVPKLMNPKSGILMEHIARYQFARMFASGRVLDIACGVGYGTAILLKSNPQISTVVGVDINKDAIDYAKEHYNDARAMYVAGDAMAESLPDEIGRFDTVVSFETIEHLQNDELFIANLYKMMKPDGTLIISTPFGKGRGIPCSNPFHVHQYKEPEFAELLNCFDTVDMYYQLDEMIEKGTQDKKYYLMVAVCTIKAKDV